MGLKPKYKRPLEFYFQVLSTQNKSPHTLLSYRQDLKRFLEWYQGHYNLPLKALTPQMINEYQYFMAHGEAPPRPKGWKVRLKGLFKKNWGKKNPSLKMDPLGPNSRRRNMSSIKSFFDILVESAYFKGQLKQSPLRPHLHRIQVKETDITPTEVLGPRDWEKLDETIWKTKDRLLIHLLYFGGLRLSELTHLKEDSLDLETGVLTFARKGGKRHRLKLWMGHLICELWESYLEKKEVEGEALFMGRWGRGISPRGLSKKIQVLLKKCGLNKKLGPHSFRKGCATALYQKTHDLLYVRDYLNHSDAKVTQTYIDEIGITGHD